jgi:hypothetical protein
MWYRSQGIEWGNPLSAGSFTRLRASLGKSADKVDGRDLLTVSSTAADADAPLRRVELTVRRSDWHAVVERVEFRDAEFELTEVAIERMPADRLPAGIFETATAPPVAVPSITESAPAPLPVDSPAPAPVPSDAQLDESEVRVREAFHAIRTDLQESPAIERAGDTVIFQVFVESSERKAEILQAVEGIPFVRATVRTAEDPAPEPASQPVQVLDAPPAAQTSQPPMAEDLVAYAGSLDIANNLLSEAHDAYLRTLVQASALDRLAARYDATEWSRLSAESRARLDRIAADYVESIRKDLPQYLNLVSPVLDNMTVRVGAARPSSPIVDGGCAGWRTSASALSAELQSIESSFRRLFVEEHGSTPMTLSKFDLLAQSVRARTALQGAFQRLCEPR